LALEIEEFVNPLAPVGPRFLEIQRHPVGSAWASALLCGPTAGRNRTDQPLEVVSAECGARSRPANPESRGPGRGRGKTYRDDEVSEDSAESRLRPRKPKRDWVGFDPRIRDPATYGA
jgi:hypothetical protein